MKIRYLFTLLILVAFMSGRASSYNQNIKNNLCEVCKKPLIEGKEAFLYENVNEHVYRCVHCALGEQVKYPDSKIITKSAVYGENITIERKNGEWSAHPEKLVILSLPEAGGECLDRHLSFVNMEEFNLYLKNNPYIAEKNPKAHTLHEIEDLLKSGAGETKHGQEESSKVYIQIVGFLNHIPVKEMIADIDRVLNTYNDSLVVELIDEESENGQLFLEKNSLTGHIPIVIFINGKYQFDINGKEVTLKGHKGYDWDIEDLDKIIHQKILEKQK